MEGKKSRIIESVLGIVLALLIACMSFFVAAKIAVSPERHEAALESLDSQRNAVLGMTAATTAISVGISAIPGDTATPLADQLADLSGYMVLILTAIYFEKFLLTLTGYAAFRFLIPLACALLAVFFVTRSASFRSIALKIIAFALAIYIIIPVSVRVTDIIRNTDNYVEVTAFSADDEEDGNKDKFIEKAKEKFNNITDAIAIFIVTNFVVPVAVLAFFVWIINLVFKTNIKSPQIKAAANEISAKIKGHRIHGAADGKGSDVTALAERDADA